MEAEQVRGEEKSEAPGEIADEGEAEPERTRAMKLGAKQQFNQETRTPIQREAAAPLVLQALFPRVIGQSHIWFDIPLVITIYFALARRSPIGGMLIGGIMGIFQDALTGHAIGIYGIAKTLSGYLAASVGVRPGAGIR